MDRTKVRFLAAIISALLVLCLTAGITALYVFGADSWDMSGFNQSEEGGETVWTDKKNSDLKYMNYNGSLKDINSIDLDLRWNEARWPEAHNGIMLYSDEGVLWYVNYNSSTKKISVSRAGANIFSYEPAVEIAADQWVHWQLTWGGRFVCLYIDGASVMRIDAEQYGDVFGEKAKISLYCWGNAFSVKNIKLSKIDGLGNGKWEYENAAESKEGAETVYTGSEASDFSKLYYKGSLEGIDSVSYSMRFNKWRWGEASGGFILYTESGANWYIDYRPDANAFRIRRNDVYQVYNTYSREIKEDEFINIKVTWNNGAIRLYVENELFLENDYTAFGDSFGKGSSCYLNSWGIPWSIKNIKFDNIGGYGLADWDSTGDFTVSDDGKSYLTESTDKVSTLVYKGGLDKALSLKAKLVYSDTGANKEGYVALNVDNYVYKIYTRADGTELPYAALYGDGGNTLICTGEGFSRDIFALGTKNDLELVFSENGAAALYVNGVKVLSPDGVAHSEPKNIKISVFSLCAEIRKPDVFCEGDDNMFKNLDEFTESLENGEKVYTAKEDRDVRVLGINADFEGINSISFDMRYNKWKQNVEASGGLVINTAGGAEWYIDYRAEANAVRIRRNGVYIVYTDLSKEMSASEWMHWQVMWDNESIYLKVNGKIMLTTSYARHGDEIGDSFTAFFNEWLMPMSIKNVMIGKATPADWRGIDLEFTDIYSVNGFTIENGSISFNDGKLVMTVGGGAMRVESPYIDVARGHVYSAFMPIRNTITVRLKNNTSADSVKVSFISDLNTEYSSTTEKTFAIEPNSDFKTYFFNFSDIIELGAAALPYKQTVDIKDSEGYLHGFALEFDEDITSGSVEIDAVTFEREAPIYNYAGEITSCIADKSANTVVIKGIVDKKYVGKTVTVYESAVNNYNEDKVYPINNERTTKLVDIEKLKSATVKADGSFEITIDLYNLEVSRLSSLFLAYVDDGKSEIKVSGHFSVENYLDFYKPEERFTVPNLSVSVLDFGAKGDAFTNDTAAIQAAIDHIASNGGGRVVIPGDDSEYGKRYVVTNLKITTSNIEIVIEKGAILWQSPRLWDYDYSSNPFLDSPVYGHDNDREGVVWAHSLYDNLPLLHITGTVETPIENIRITGGGTIRMWDHGSEQPDAHNYAWSSNLTVGCSSRIHIIPVGAFNVKHYDFTNITIMRTNSYHTTSKHCEDIYFENCNFKEAVCINGDGFGITACDTVTINRCFAYTNDDVVTLCVNRDDLRNHVWAFDIPGGDDSTQNIHIRSSQLWGGLGIAFIPWGTTIENEELASIRDIYIFDNVLGGESCAIGCWPDNPNYGWSSFYDYNLDNGEGDDWSPIYNVQFINNNLRKPYNMRVANFANLTVKGLRYNGKEITYGNSLMATNFLNGDFDKNIRSTEEKDGFKDEREWVSGLANWTYLLGNNGSVGTVSIGQKEITAIYTGKSATVTNYAGFLKGDGELFEGIYKTFGSYSLSIKVKSVKGTSTLFVRDLESGEIIAEKKLENSDEFKDFILAFDLEESKPIQLGIKHEGGADDIVYIDDATVKVNLESDTYKVEGESVTIGKSDLSVNATANNVSEKDGKIVVGADSEYKLIYDAADDLDTFDFSVDIDLKKNDRINAGVYVFAGNVGNGQDAIDAYNVHIEKAAGANTYTVYVYRFENSYLGSVASKGGISIANEKATLRVISKRDTLFVFVDTVEEPIITIDLPEGLSGCVGLRTQHAAACFSNLKLVMGKEAEPTPPTPPVITPSITTANGTGVQGTSVNEGKDTEGSILPAILIGAAAVAAIGALASVIIIKKRKTV